MSEEIWRECVFDNRYKVSSQGRVIGQKKTILAANANSHGYRTINLRSKKKVLTYAVHRMVAMTFLENPLGLSDVNHINMNRADNRVENLEWVTRSQNILKSRRDFNVDSGANSHIATFDDITALAIFTCFSNRKMSYVKISNDLGISRTAINHMARGNSWRNLATLIEFIPFRKNSTVSNRFFIEKVSHV